MDEQFNVRLALRCTVILTWINIEIRQRNQLSRPGITWHSNPSPAIAAG